MTFVAGIDMGAKSTKALILDGEKRVCGKARVKTRPDFHAVAKEVLDLALQGAGLKETDLNYIATTGFGRYNVPFRDVQITDITCVGRGAVFLFPKTRCVLDIGAQSTRALRVSDTGKVREFRTNDIDYLATSPTGPATATISTNVRFNETFAVPGDDRTRTIITHGLLWDIRSIQGSAAWRAVGTLVEPPDGVGKFTGHVTDGARTTQYVDAPLGDVLSDDTFIGAVCAAATADG